MDRPTDATRIRPAEVPQNRPLAFRLAPDEAARAALAGELGAEALQALRFEGTLTAPSRDEVLLEGRLKANAIQACVVTLAPVRTAIDEPVRRRFLAGWTEPEGDEVEMDEDTDTGALPPVIDLAAVMAEALALALPLYPRAAGVAEPEPAAEAEETHRPFAGLGRLLGGSGEGGSGGGDGTGSPEG